MGDKDEKIIVFVSVLFAFVVIPTDVSAQENLFGRYEVTNENSLIKEIHILENRLQIVIDNEYLVESETEDKTVKKVMDYKNLMVNEDALYGVVDLEAQSDEDNSQNQQYLEINFFDGQSFPSFSLDIVNPEYLVIDNQLIVKYRGDRFWDFNIEEGQISMDNQDVHFELVE